MIKITNEIDGKKYELVRSRRGCKGCAFYTKTGCNIGTPPKWRCITLCFAIDGIWKEVKDGESII